MQCSLHSSVKNTYPTGYSSSIYTLHCIVLSIAFYTLQNSIRYHMIEVENKRIEGLKVECVLPAFETVNIYTQMEKTSGGARCTRLRIHASMQCAWAMPLRCCTQRSAWWRVSECAHACTWRIRVHVLRARRNGGRSTSIPAAYLEVVEGLSGARAFRDYRDLYAR